MSDVERRCKGTSRRTGEPCKNRAFKGSDYCWFHGAKALGNKGGKGRPKGSPKPPGAGGPAAQGERERDVLRCLHDQAASPP